MKKLVFLFAILLCSLTSASPIQDHKIDPSALKHLAEALEIPPDTNIIEETQKRWLRKPGQERWEMNELSADQKHFVLNWSQEQGLFSPWKPLYQSYDKALILGAVTSCMQKRLDYLKKLWEEGVCFNEIIWLTGDRPLDSKIDSFTNRCHNESEAAHILWEETELPEEMRDLPVLFIAVPMHQEGSLLKRPNTEDTIIAWLKVSPTPCKALFISDQPFCGYQFAVIKALLPETFLFDLVGEGVDPTSHPAAAAITLDSIARWIYQDTLTP